MANTVGKGFLGLVLVASASGPRKFYANLSHAAELDDTPYALIWNPTDTAAGSAPLPLECGAKKMQARRPASFIGEWIVSLQG
jgi:hypothetical protein